MVEDWETIEGIEYVLGILCNVELVEVEPADSLFGELMDALIALWATTVSALVIGFVGAFGFASQIGVMIERGKKMKYTKTANGNAKVVDGDAKVDSDTDNSGL